MKSKQHNISAIASGVALGLASIAAQAADQPALSTAGPAATASFAGGATVNGGASYISSVPANVPADLVATITPATSDVGSEGDLIAALDVPGVGVFNLLSGGIWLPLDTSNVYSYATKTLEAQEQVTVLDDLVGSTAGLEGATLSAFVGYYTGGNLANLTYSATPATMTIDAAAGASCPANTFAGVGTFKGKDVCILSGRIESDTHLTNNFSYLLDGAVFVGANDLGGDRTQLTIDAGTYIVSETGLNFLVIDRNGQIFANGSADQPVIFTYVEDDTATASTTGQWGGLILNGNAPLNVSGGTAEGEGSTGTYGGTDSADSSGSLTYVQVKYAGQNITESNELNGIAFQGTGSGTVVDYVQVHNNSDDGIEFFGGSTNAKHILLTGNEDDALDWTFGWDGKVQFVAMKQNAASEHCIEADNNGDDNDATPRSNPTISNMTCAGPDTNSDSGFRLREGTSASLYNVVMTAFEGYNVDIDQDATFQNAGGSIANLNGNLTMGNSRLDTNATFDDDAADAFLVSEWYGAQMGSALMDVSLGGTSGLANSNELNAVTPMIPSDSFFDQVDYIGAVKDDSSDWTLGWSYSD